MVAAALAVLALAAAPVQIGAPRAGEPYVSPLRVAGVATVPFTVELANWDGLVVARKSVAHTGRFSFALRFPKGLYARGSLIVHPRAGRVTEIQLGTRVLSVDGFLGVEPGASPAAVRKAWKVPLALISETGSTCAAAPVKVAGMSGYALFVRSRFGAVFMNRGAVDEAGIRIGSTVAQLRAAYGARLSSRPDKYVPGARNYFVKKRWQLRFDVSKAARVTMIGFGDANVRLVEGCA